ncbi:hypothetical protein A0O34_15050 [Chryseobacterium glaciei]|uniref:Uncharacterized protein n=1 Tax=Chryseobacterium glaciei TaxID=1685010 RepID=A0A172XXT0_9FLAO|nr:hypothetical protein [Chryseobacterium glaciei]ANF51741.1 hypothetical protein A0O34_15050 [Chryseobacterium glaciei]
MDKYFLLVVKRGSVVNRPNGQRQTLTEVPKNALELWEEGTLTLCLRKDGLELLNDFSKERLEKVLQLRKNLNYRAEIQLLESSIKNFGKAKKADKAE